MNKIALLFFIFASFAQAQSPSARVADLKAEMELKQGEVQQLTGQIEEFNATISRLEKENKVLTENRDLQVRRHNEIMERSESYAQTALRQAKIENDRLNDGWISQGCTGDLPEARFRVCERLHADYANRVQVLTNEVNTRNRRVMDEAKREAASITDIVRRQDARIDKIVQDVAANFNASSRLDDQRRVAQARIRAIRIEMADICERSPSARQICTGALNFDGSRR